MRLRQQYQKWPRASLRLCDHQKSGCTQIREQLTHLVTVLDDRLRPLPAAAPHTPHDGREPEAVVGCRPQLHDVPGGGLLRRLHDRRELF